MNQSINDLSSKIQNLQTSYGTLENNVKEITKSLQSRNPEATSSISSASVANNVVDEISERDKRKCNLIEHNLPEEPLDNHHSDKDTFSELCKISFNLNVNIVKVVRLGQKLTTKPRSLLIQVNDEEIHKQILANAPKLRFSTIWIQVYIQPDLSPKEREAHKKLYEELKKRRDNGENLIIRNGKIIPYIPRLYRPHVITNPSTASNTSTSIRSLTVFEPSFNASNTSMSNRPLTAADSFVTAPKPAIETDISAEPSADDHDQAT